MNYSFFFIQCHTPSSCPIDSPCPKMIEVTCECGHIKQQARCATSEARPEGNAKRVVKCTDACVTLKRNTALADALGIEKREVKTREVEYDPLMLNFAKDNLVRSLLLLSLPLFFVFLFVFM